MGIGMTPYTAPLEALSFAARTAVDNQRTPAEDEQLDAETYSIILSENARLSETVLAPLSRTSDMHHPVLHPDGVVTTTEAMRSAYRDFKEGGWPGAPTPVAVGGLGMSRLAWAPLAEMWNSANPAFALCPVGNVGAIDALLAAADPSIVQLYVPKMVAGTWLGTMNITEPQAGSDLSLIRTRALPNAEKGPGHYKLYGQKIFISYGEHDLAENIIHLVLARLPDAPPGVKGLTLFLVPKYLVDDAGNIGARNDVKCVSLENKLGIHGSPTAVMIHGETSGAQGILVGKEHRGLEAMFVMMNLARFSLGLQGTGIAERATQAAIAYAASRLQGRQVASGKSPVAIMHHPGVKKCLLGLRSNTHAARNLTYYSAALLDACAAAQSPHDKVQAQRTLDFLTPIVKGWVTEIAVKATNDAMQVFGGMGYIEETGVAQLLRDARITTIYEGTTTIQANDLVHRKVIADKGATFAALALQVLDTATRLKTLDSSRLVRLGQQLADAVAAARTATDWIVAQGSEDIDSVLAVAESYLEICGRLFGGWRLLEAAMRAFRGDAGDECSPALQTELLDSARYFGDWMLEGIGALSSTIRFAGKSVTEATSF